MADNGRRTILVVDDSPQDIAILNEELKVDYRVQAATDLVAASRLAHANPPPDLILLDVMMPGMDGYQFCRALKAEPATRSIPVIFVTARGAAESEAAGFEAGGVDYIAKPVNPQLVKARARTHIELKAAREELEKKNEVLEENVRLREEVEAINRHDLKNPLMVLMNMPEALQACGSLTEAQKKILRLTDVACGQMLEMINRTVDLFKMEKGVYTVHAVPVNALQLIEQAFSALQPLIKAKDLLVATTAGGRPVARGDSFTVLGEQLLAYSMLANLLKNAVEASPAGGTVTVSLGAPESGEQGPARISIHNHGAIPAAIRSRFFAKFTTAGKERGTGVGAYSARLMARTLGGEIGFQSSEETGTTITIQLPRP